MQLPRATHLVVIVKGTREHAETVRAACRTYLEGTLRLTLNMEKTQITHVDDGFTFLGHRIIRKRGGTGRKRPVTQIPQDRAQRLVQRLVRDLSTDYARNRLEVVAHLNRQLAGWATFYQYTDYTARVYRRLDHVVFWQLARWMARKYRSGVARELRRHVRAPQPGAAKTWVITGRWPNGQGGTVVLRRLAGSPKGQFRWRNPPRNPYILAPDTPPLLTSRYRDVAFAVQH